MVIGCPAVTDAGALNVTDTSTPVGRSTVVSAVVRVAMLFAGSGSASTPMADVVTAALPAAVAWNETVPDAVVPEAMPPIGHESVVVPVHPEGIDATLKLGGSGPMVATTFVAASGPAFATLYV
jgi:hypothetical protein